MRKGFQKGTKGGKNKSDERLVRTPELDARFNATPASTSTSATHFIFCLSLYLRGFITPHNEWLQETECVFKFSKWLSWIFRHGKELLHDSLSLTLHELFHFDLFIKHI